MTAKARLLAELDRALALGRADRIAEAEALLRVLAADPEAAVLGPSTALGLPRKLHSMRLKLAKISGDPAAIAGLRATAVPPAGVIDDLFRLDAAGRAAMIAAAARPVPQLLHQVWVGGAPAPVACAAWRDWAGRHGWGYRLWDEAALAGLGITDDPIWRGMVEAGDLPGAVDLARYRLLSQLGGLYLDCDWYPAQPALPPTVLLPQAGLSALAEASPRLVGGESLLLSNALIATPPGHPALSLLLEALPEVQRRLVGGPAWWVTGPLPFTLAVRGGPVAVLDPTMVAGHLPRAAPLAEAQAMARASAGGPGFLIAWKGW